MAAVSAVELPADDEDRQLTVIAGDAVTLHCPLYQPSTPVHITWLYADTYRTPVVVDRTKAISDNGRGRINIYLLVAFSMYVREILE